MSETVQTDKLGAAILVKKNHKSLFYHIICLSTRSKHKKHMFFGLSAQIAPIGVVVSNYVAKQSYLVKQIGGRWHASGRKIEELTETKRKGA